MMAHRSEIIDVKSWNSKTFKKKPDLSPFATVLENN